MTLQRADLPILVVQGESLGALAVVRSLGRAGYQVHACSTDGDALGLQSNYAAQRVTCPEYSSKDFVPWLRSYVREHRIRAIVPSESLLLAIRPYFDEFSSLLVCGHREEVVFAGMSKYDLFARIADTGHLPPTILVDDLRSPPERAELSRLGFPLYLKFDGAYSRLGENGSVSKADSADDALKCLAESASRFSRSLVQGHVEGRGVGAFFLMRNGEVFAEFMHRRIHEVPHTGGASSLRESWFHQQIRDDALLKLRAMQWEGVAMMEYRWNAKTDDFYLMEMNGRFWGSLHLALAAGIDFPKLLLDAFFGEAVAPHVQFPLGVQCRNTFPGELQYLWSRLRDGRLAWADKAWSFLEFGLLSLDPRVRNDLSFPGDRALVFRGMAQAVSSTAKLFRA